MSGEARGQRLFVVLAAFFVVNAVLAEFIGVKIFALEDTLGVAPFRMEPVRPVRLAQFHRRHAAVADRVHHDRHGQRVLRRKGVRFISWLAVALILYGFVFAFAAIGLAPAGWWIGAMQSQGVPDQQAAFAAISDRGYGRSPARWSPS
jgi:hypothetical protein